MELFHSAYTSGLHSVDNCVFGRSASQYTAEMSGVGAAAPAVAWAELVTLAAALIEAVVRRSGVKKKDAKPVIEAMLAELGETLAAGRNLSLEPFGKAKVVREKEIQNGRMLVLRLRQKDRVTATLPTATAAE